MLYLITLVALCITLPYTCFGSSEKMPIISKPITLLTEPQRQEMLRTTRAMPVCNGPCSRNPAFVENMATLLVADKATYNLSCCFGMGAQRCMYASGCTCEHPCAYICAAGCAGFLAAIGMFIGASIGALPTSIAYPIAFGEGMPAALVCMCGLLEECSRCKAGSKDQLDYITDPNNFTKKGFSNNRA